MISKETPGPNVWVGSQTGLLKSVNFQKKLAKNHFEKTDYGSEFEILSMCWDRKEKSKIHLGLKNGLVKTYDPEALKFVDSVTVPLVEKDGHICSLKKVQDNFVIGMTSGKVVVQNPADELPTTFMSGGDDLSCLAAHLDSSMVATGGKENSVKVWDLNNLEKAVFTAKNVKPDWLQLRVPVWVTSVKFVDNSPTKVLTTTGTHHIRIYDLNAKQRRPVLETEYDEYPITCSSMIDRDPNKVYVANTHGSMASFDIRKLKQVYRCFKGAAGSVRHLENHPTSPHLFSCGLDRYMRVHDENRGAVIHKIYLKSQLNCLLVTDTLLPDKSEKQNSNEKKEKDDDDCVWDNMETAKDSDDESSNDESSKPKKRRVES